jgi:hypothetical protein
MKKNRTYKLIPAADGHTLDQINDQIKLAQIILSVPGERRSMFSLIVESMIMGAELAERAQAERIAEMESFLATAASNTT